MKMETVQQNLFDTAKAVLREKFIVINTYVKKKKSQIKNLTLNLEELEKKQQTQPKVDGKRN